MANFQRISVAVQLDGLGAAKSVRHVQNLEPSCTRSCAQKVVDLLNVRTSTSAWSFLECAKMVVAKILWAVIPVDAIRDLHLTSTVSSAMVRIINFISKVKSIIIVLSCSRESSFQQISTSARLCTGFVETALVATLQGTFSATAIQDIAAVK